METRKFMIGDTVRISSPKLATSGKVGNITHFCSGYADVRLNDGKVHQYKTDSLELVNKKVEESNSDKFFVCVYGVDGDANIEDLEEAHEEDFLHDPDFIGYVDKKRIEEEVNNTLMFYQHCFLVVDGRFVIPSVEVKIDI